MMALRALCFVVGILVLIVSPFVLLPQTDGGVFAGGKEILAGVSGIVLFAVGYFYLAIAGYRASRSLRLRLMAACFTLLQLAGGAAALYFYHDPEVMLLVAPLLCFSIFVFISFVWPGARNRAYRPLRRREEADHVYPR